MLGIPVHDMLISILFYADDIVLLAETEPELQTMLNKLNEWCSKWKMKINETKTNVVHFGNKHQLKTQYVFKVGNNSLNVVDRYKYLGIILNEILEFEITASFLADAASRGLGAMIGKTKHLIALDFETFEKLFTTGVVPIMHYGSEVLGFKRFHVTEGIQNRAIRCMPTIALRSEAGWYSVRCKHWINIVKYWNRLVNMSQSTLTAKLFHWDYEKSVYNNNWCSELRILL